MSCRTDRSLQSVSDVADRLILTPRHFTPVLDGALRRAGRTTARP